MTDFVLAGIEDAGTNLPALHYFLVCNRFGLFVQQDARPGALDDRLARAALVQELAIADGAAGLLHRDPWMDSGKLVVVDCAFGTTRWYFSGMNDAAGLDGLDGAASFLEHRAQLLD